MSTTHFPAAPAPAPGARRVTHDSHDSMEGSGEGTPSPEFWCHEAASGATVAKVVSAANIACQAPAHVSTDNSCHLTLVLSAAKETQTYLQRIRPLVLQLGDSTATEDITRAFKFTALSSQFLLASDLPNASSALIETWTAIQQLEERLAHKTSASHSGLRGHKTFSPPGANGSPVPCDLSAAGMPHLGKKALLSSKHSFSPPVPGSEMERHPGALVSLPGGPTPNVDSRAVNPRRSSKRKSEAEMKKESTHENVGGLTLPLPNRNDPNIIAKRLKVLMERTQSSQAQLQNWDKLNGLPKSHSQTMVNSSRSRQQLQRGIVLKKWNGAPLISPAEQGPTTPMATQERHGAETAVEDLAELQKRCAATFHSAQDNEFSSAGSAAAIASAARGATVSTDGAPSNPLSILVAAVHCLDGTT